MGDSSRRARIVGFDTETWRGRAVLLGSEDGYHCEPRGFYEVASFLLRERYWAAWNLTYDAQACLAWLPRDVLKRLGLTTRATWDGGLALGEVFVRWVPGKMFTLRAGKRSTTVLDAWPFYQCSLDSAARKYLDEGKDPMPRTWFKRVRAVLRGPNRDRFVAYCVKDAALAGRLYRLVAGGMKRLGIEPRRAVSPGTYAACYFRGQMKAERLPRAYQRPASRAFYGGRIEVFRRGLVEDAEVYDIRSAYPAEVAGLVSLQGATVLEEKEPREDAAYGVFRVRWTVRPGPFVHLVPLRLPDGLVIYPSGTWRAWTDLDTLRAARETGAAEAEVLKGWQWVPRSWEYPWRAKVERLFKLRERPEMKLPAKLVLNSLYGKLAERVKVARRLRGVLDPREDVVWPWGSEGPPFVRREERPPTSNVLLAAAVTARVRVRVYKALLAAGNAPVFAATDSVALLGGSPPPGLLGPSLGSWDREYRGPLLVVGSGVYARTAQEGPGWSWKVRGFHTRDLGAMLRERPQGRVLPLRELRAVSLGQLVRWKLGTWADLNVLKSCPRSLDLDFDRKRVWENPAPRCRDILGGCETGGPPRYYGVLRPG